MRTPVTAPRVPRAVCSFTAFQCITHLYGLGTGTSNAWYLSDRPVQTKSSAPACRRQRHRDRFPGVAGPQDGVDGRPVPG